MTIAAAGRRQVSLATIAGVAVAVVETHIAGGNARAIHARSAAVLVGTCRVATAAIGQRRNISFATV